MEHSFACLDHQQFLKSNEIVRISRGLISLFDTPALWTIESSLILRTAACVLLAFLSFEFPVIKKPYGVCDYWLVWCDTLL